MGSPATAGGPSCSGDLAILTGVQRRWRGAQRPAPIDDADVQLLRLDHEPLGDAIALEGDDVAGLQRQHLLVTAKAGAIAEFAIQSEADPQIGRAQVCTTVTNA